MCWRRLDRISALGLAVFVVLSLVPAAPARAQESGPYVTAGGGFANRQRSGEDAFTYIDFGNDYAVNVAGGYRYEGENRARNMAVEGEFSYLRNTTQTVSSAVTGPQAGLGDVTLRVGMVNVRYDLPIPATAFGAYVAGGIGGYKSYLNNVSNVVAQPFGFVANASSQGVTFAFQVRAGALFRLAPRADLLAGYRYLHGGDLTFLNTAFGDLRPTGARIHSFEAALRVRF